MQSGILAEKRSLAAPAAVAAAVLAAGAVLHLRDPHTPGAYGVCPFHAATGLWCPGCGGMRAINDLTNGDLLAALSSNVLVPPLLVFGLVMWMRWVLRRWRGEPSRRGVSLPMAAGPVILVGLTVFTVLRNTPWGHWLAPT